MSRELSKKRIYNQRDWDNADMLGRIEISIINPDYFVLSGNEEAYYIKMRKTFHILCECHSELEAYRMMKEIFVDMSHSMVYKLIADTQTFFSSIIKQNVLFDKLIQSNRILKHIELASQAGEYNAVAKLEKQYTEVRGTAQKIENSFAWESLKFPEIEETTDTSVLFADAEIIEDEEE